MKASRSWLFVRNLLFIRPASTNILEGCHFIYIGSFFTLINCTALHFAKEEDTYQSNKLQIQIYNRYIHGDLYLTILSPYGEQSKFGKCKNVALFNKVNKYNCFSTAGQA